MQKRKNLANKERKMGAINNVYILHGWTYSTDKWQPFINLLKQKGMEANILKIPGLTQKLDKVWKTDDYVEWLKQTMKQSNNKVILIGHSNGGRIALNFAIKYPQQISNLILIDNAGIYHNDLYLKIKRLVFDSVAKIGKKLSSSERFRNLLYKIVGESDYKNANAIMKKTMLNLINSDKSLSLEKVTVPTLIIWGREDTTTPLSDGKLINRQIKNSKLHIIDSAKHSPQFTHPNQVAETIVNNLAI